MKKFILGAVLSLGILASPAFTYAAGLTDSQVQSILSLLSSFGADSATIANVNSALTGAPTTGSQDWCHNFNKDIAIGSGGQEVYELNHALTRSGIDALTTSRDPYTFDEDTSADVVTFQAKYGIRQTGYVGKMTRAKLNKLYGCASVKPIATTPSLPTLTFTASPETIAAGQTSTLTWSSKYATSCLLNDGAPATLANDILSKGTSGSSVTPGLASTNVFTMTCKGPGGVTTSSVTVNVSTPTTSSGSLTVTRASGDPSSGLIVAGSNSVQVAEFELAAQNTSYVINKLSLSIPGLAAGLSIGSVDLKFSKYSTDMGGVGTAAVAPIIEADGSAVAIFTGLNFFIPKDSRQTLRVYVSVRTIADGAQPGSSINVHLRPEIKAMDASGAYKTKFDGGSGGSVTSGAVFNIYRSVPTVAQEALPLGQLNDGRLIRFSVSADPAGDIKVAQLSFRFSGLAPDTNGQVALYAGSNIVGTMPVSSGSPGGNMWLDRPVDIPAGKKVVFDLRDDRKGTGISNTNNLMTTLLGQSPHGGTVAPMESWRYKEASFIWTAGWLPDDKTWTSGYLVRGLPIDGISQKREGGIVAEPLSASLTINGTKDSYEGTLKWSTNGTADNTTLVYESICPGSGSRKVAASGTEFISERDCDTTITYKASNSVTGRSASDSVTVRAHKKYTYTSGAPVSSQSAGTPRCACDVSEAKDCVEKFTSEDQGNVCYDFYNAGTDPSGPPDYVNVPYTRGDPITVNALGLSQMASVAAGLASILGTQSSSARVDLPGVLTDDVFRGMSGEIVSLLQQMLKKEGVYREEITGNFYDITYDAVIAFQKKYGIKPTGYVGPATRAKLNELY